MNNILFSILHNNSQDRMKAVDFLHQSRAEENNGVEISDDWVDKILEKAYVYVALSNDKIVGWFVLYCNNYETRIAYVAGVTVLNAYRGRGIAKNLLEKAIEKCRQLEFSELTLYCNNPIAERLYLNYGFECIRTERVPRLNNELYNFMVKKI